jgi:hypothetical protein
MALQERVGDRAHTTRTSESPGEIWELNHAREVGDQARLGTTLRRRLG